MMKKLMLAAAVTFAASAYAGEWHSGESNLCTDCHTMHFSQQHNWDGTSPVSTTPQPNGNWLSATGPNAFLLKAPANQLCLACHDGQTFAPDVMAANVNAAPTQGRSAGALNQAASGAGYETWKGHTLDATTAPPGFNPAAVGAPATWYDPAGGLECISCHAQHGPVTSYRNLGPYSLGAAAASARPTYVIATTNDATKDVWINIPTGYAANSGSAATFNPFYATASVSYNRNDATVATTKTSNKLDTLCGTCHGNFHGGAGDANIGGAPLALDAFIRHPTSQVTIGAAGAQGYGGHSNLPRYVANTTKTKVYASDRTAFTDAAPGCVSCHKAHGNQNPFGLVFLDRNATSVGEEGGFGPDDADTSVKTGYRNLCGQCHGQGD